MNLGNKKILVHKGIRTISIYNFCMIVKTSDFRFLIKNYNEDEDTDAYSEFMHDSKLEEVWNSIRDDYDKFVGDKSERKKYIALLGIDEMEATLSLISNILDIYTSSEDPKILWELNSIKGFTFKHYKPVQDQLNIIIKRVKHLKNKLSIAQIKFEDKYLSNIDENESKLKNIIDDIESTAQVFEIDLGVPYKINTKETSVLRWLNLIKLKEQKDKEADSNAKKIKR